MQRLIHILRTQKFRINCVSICRRFSDKSVKYISKLKHRNESIRQIEGITKLPQMNAFMQLIMKKPNELIQWYAKTPPDRRKVMYLSAMIVYLIYPLGFICVLSVLYMTFHSEENPFTGRQTVVNIPKEMLDQMESDLFKEIFIENVSSGTFLPSSDPAVKRMDRCVERIINANNDIDVIGDGNWTPVVINNDQLLDIIVLKESHNIFISKKILDLCETDDELAYLLCHQLSHVMLDHTREPTTYASKLYVPLMAFLPKIWTINQDPVLRFEFMETLNTYFDNKIKECVRKGIYLNPYNEVLECEADRIAMQLLTRACFDVRKCHQFCAKYANFTQTHTTDGHTTNDHFFAKHPITENKLWGDEPYGTVVVGPESGDDRVLPSGEVYV
ncbi:unnamed protein product [Medioppia subpectinata]|uniref:Metalloendopeptidase OMA1, mitochondrial n=1 Tax=Medioppia subpectinata TaxID=1979941 RepID=A0A7R9KDX1_9ACAR|nr:unnamed protein product [Medioppia subpectinata]CAG2101536.1 unnamed protein product [Medioppia subpectinata]